MEEVGGVSFVSDVERYSGGVSTLSGKVRGIL